MRWPSWALGVLVAAAGLAMWLLLSGPERVLGFDGGNLGVFLLMTVAWVSLYGISVVPANELEQQLSPSEWKAWMGVAFTALSAIYFLSKARLVLGADDPRDLQVVGRTLVMLLLAWTIVSWVLESRWRGRVQEDERDREIAAMANGWGRGALTFLVIAVAVSLGLSPPHRLEWATPLAVANVLIFGLIWSCLVEYMVTAIAYWRDRRVS